MKTFMLYNMVKNNRQLGNLEKVFREKCYTKKKRIFLNVLIFNNKANVAWHAIIRSII